MLSLGRGSDLAKIHVLDTIRLPRGTGWYGTFSGVWVFV